MWGTGNWIKKKWCIGGAVILTLSVMALVQPLWTFCKYSSLLILMLLVYSYLQWCSLILETQLQTNFRLKTVSQLSSACGPYCYIMCGSFTNKHQYNKIFSYQSVVFIFSRSIFWMYVPIIITGFFAWKAIFYLH